MHAVDESGVGDAVGDVTVHDSGHGVVFSPRLYALPPGLHGFHVHQKPSCKARREDGEMTAAAAAGGHYAPDGAEDHAAPWGNGTSASCWRCSSRRTAMPLTRCWLRGSKWTISRTGHS